MWNNLNKKTNGLRLIGIEIKRYVLIANEITTHNSSNDVHLRIYKSLYGVQQYEKLKSALKKPDKKYVNISTRKLTA